MTSATRTSRQLPAPEAFRAAPGSSVVIRDEDWLVTGVEKTTDGHFVHVIGLSELVRNTEATFSTALDYVEEADPRSTRVVADDSERYRKSRLWLESILRKSPIPIAEPGLTIAESALADALPYQAAAVRQALDPANLRPRILLADAVGLGKTLEIGMILSELVRRGRGERILVVTPKHVLEQTQFELWTRFALPFVRLDSTGIQRIRQKLPANRNPFAFFKRVIVSIDTLKSDKYVAHLGKQRWDAVVIDESHNVTNTATQNNRLARLLARQSDALILASATPHNGRPESFAELVRMLEPSAVTPQGEVIKSELKRLIIRRHRHSPDVARVVGGDWAARKPPRNRLVEPSPIEEEIALELERTWLWPSGRSPYSGRSGSSLFPWTLAKAFLSSPAAFEESISNRLRSLAKGVDSDESLTAGEDVDADAIGLDEADDEQRANLSPQGPVSASTERDALMRLHALAERGLRERSAKYDELVRVLQEAGVGAGSDARAVVFAERVATLRWLQDKLTADFGFKDESVRVLHGGLSDAEQQEIVESFKLASSPIRVLVTGDVASEGVNLHSQCHNLIHYDIPWSLIRIEQRNGRIDRYGQKHSPLITTLLLDPRSTARFGGDIRVLTRLVEREHHAHTALGEAASLMGKHSVRAEEKEIADVLRGTRDEASAVATVDQVSASEGLAGMFARMFGADAASTAAAAPEPLIPQASAPSGLFDDDVEFLSDALHLIYTTPGRPPADGVSWEPKLAPGLVSLTPPTDLQSRLDILPQSYLQERRVTDRLTLATTVARGKQELAQAKEAESTTAWPEAHYLAPLHPVLDWVADRALAELGRNQVFVVRGGVDAPTVLIQGTLTNKRGQVVAAQYVTVTFPFGDQGLIQPHVSAQDAISTLRLSTTNTGAIEDADAWQRLVTNAVDSAATTVEAQVEAVKAETAERVESWLNRTRQWQQGALDLPQSRGRSFSERKRDVDAEKELAEAMEPDRTLIRPLLVVIPTDGDR